MSPPAGHQKWTSTVSSLRGTLSAMRSERPSYAEYDQTIAMDRFHRWASAAALIGIGIGIIGIAFWLHREGPPTGLDRFTPNIRPLTSSWFIATGAALVLAVRNTGSRTSRLLSSGLALAVCITAIATIAAYAAVPTLKVVAELEEGVSVRPRLLSAVGFLLLGLSLLCINSRRLKVCLHQPLSAVAGFLSLGVLIGQLFRSDVHSGLPTLSFWPFDNFNTPGSNAYAPFGILVLTFGVLLARPDQGVLRAITSPHVGGVAARKILLGTLLLVPCVILLAIGRSTGLYDLPTMATLLGIASLLYAAVLIHRVANVMNRVDESRHATERALAEEVTNRTAVAAESEANCELAQRALAARDDILRIVIHDLRTPLGSIILSAGRLRSQTNDERLNKIADTITRSCRRADQLIQDLLDVSRLETHQFVLQKAPADLAGVFREVVNLFEEEAQKTNVELVVESGSFPYRLEFDRHRIVQLLSNLVQNALKFTPPGGRISVGASMSSTDVIVSVKDTGSGIEERALERIFDKFWQGNRGDNRGAGLGLTIARGIVEAHGGKISVDSHPGRGTKFYFTIPRALTMGSGGIASLDDAEEPHEIVA